MVIGVVQGLAEPKQRALIVVFVSQLFEASDGSISISVQPISLRQPLQHFLRRTGLHLKHVLITPDCFLIQALGFKSNAQVQTYTLIFRL